MFYVQQEKIKVTYQYVHTKYRNVIKLYTIYVYF